MHELEIDAAEMRRLGYAVIDALVDWQTSLRERPVWNGATRPETESLVSREQPLEGVGAAGFDELLRYLMQDVVARGARTDHPRFFAFVPGNATWPGVLGDLIAAGTNVFQGTWLASAGVSQLELRVLAWFAEWLGMPPTAGGLFVSGGSAANLTALACARQLQLHAHDPRARIYASAETHSSVARAARILGFTADQIRTVPVDDEQRIRVDELRSMIAHDRSTGALPFFVVANGGTTSTGAVDSLREIGALCKAESLWFHVDAAYGGFAVLTDYGRALLDGIGEADSVTLDPHKWLHQPFEAGCLMMRDASALRRAFHVMPDYLRDTAVADQPDAPVNFAERGVQLTRYARTIKIWLSLHFFGVQAFRASIDRAIQLTRYAEQRIAANEEFEIISPARLGIVCFRRRHPGVAPDAADLEMQTEKLNESLLRSLMQSGVGLISSTRVAGTYALRFCILSYRTTEDDVDTVIDFLSNS
jgi:glutamate/tyrosine decarboxylase-like PLP-dependent enzyme